MDILAKQYFLEEILCTHSRLMNHFCVWEGGEGRDKKPSPYLVDCVPYSTLFPFFSIFSNSNSKSKEVPRPFNQEVEDEERQKILCRARSVR
ncbi:10996_t:CDS:2 [Diversispora eburnea]|uniref:10996_t:CDS:1 n=1 Tax=Diversispora eburnea TaxID=1213867 RepID=A0A9N9FZ13_9GLOM|nr:10996_t:CDS:2 [Diversispora eburnea]